jgi:F-type H+-transporting ATPase subunit epsilon
MLNLEILSPTKKIYEGQISSIVLPGDLGSFGVLPNHAPIISTLSKGKIIWEANNKKEELEINGGVVEVINNKVSVLVK